jgi:hypothetical protein
VLIMFVRKATSAEAISGSSVRLAQRVFIVHRQFALRGLQDADHT